MHSGFCFVLNQCRGGLCHAASRILVPKPETDPRLCAVKAQSPNHRTQAHPSPILSLLEPGDLGEGVAQKGNPGPRLLRRGNPVPRVVGTSWRLQEKPGGSGRVEGRPPVSFLQLFVKCSPSQNLLGHRTCSTERAPTPPHPGFSTLHSCQPCLPASLWDATHLGVCSSPPNHPHPPT